MKIFILLLSFLCYSCKSQNTLTEVDLKKQIPKDLIIDKIEQLNFDDDIELETIITASDESYSKLYEFWFKKDKLFKKIVYPWVSINYKWFINLDNDNLYEIIRAQGYEDGIDYGIFDIVDNKHIPLLFFTPTLIDENYPNDLFWGYPWDVNHVLINNKKELLVSLSNSIEREDDYKLGINQKKLPIIFFEGRSTQTEFKFDKHKIKTNFLDINMLISKTN